jgi:MFS family permease
MSSGNFPLLWIGQLVSSIGDWMLMIAVPVTVYNTSHSKPLLSGVLLTEAIPMLIFSPFGGIMSDRWDRRRLMILTDILRATAIALLIAPGVDRHIASYFVVLFVVSGLTSFFSPARSAIVADVIPRNHLIRANAQLNISSQIAIFVGPALGGIALGVLKKQGVFGVDCLTFLFSAGCSVLMRTKVQLPQETIRGFRGVLTSIGEGLNFALTRPPLRELIWLWNIGFIAVQVINAPEYAFAHDTLHVGQRTYGFLIACGGIGSVLGGFLLSTLFHKSNTGRLLTFGMAATAVGAAALGISKTFDMAVAPEMLLGLGSVMVNIATFSLVQATVPRDMLGRFFSVFGVASRFAQIIGGTLAALLVSRVDLSHLYVYVGAALVPVTMITGLTLITKTEGATDIKAP